MNNYEILEQKICHWQQLKEQVEKWHQNNEKVVFTNGCFDILHYGHILYLSKAADLGDRLVIGLNSSDSIRRLKGPNRPINTDLTRQFQMAAIQFVDCLTFFGEDTPLELIQTITPDVLVKGGDWKPEQIVGSEWVLSHGGRVESLQYIDGYSTTAIEKKIKTDTEK